ncbi:MAG: hypothetical protein ABJA67_01865, partial [Chthonomonadales bacterium]
NPTRARLEEAVAALEGGHQFVSDYSQWEALQADNSSSGDYAAEPETKPALKPEEPPKPRLNAAERKELTNMETTIHAAEEEVTRLEARMLLPEVATNPLALAECWEQVGAAKERVAELYSRWEELEGRR